LKEYLKIFEEVLKIFNDEDISRSRIKESLKILLWLLTNFWTFGTFFKIHQGIDEDLSIGLDKDPFILRQVGQA